MASRDSRAFSMLFMSSEVFARSAFTWSKSCGQTMVTLARVVPAKASCSSNVNVAPAARFLAPPPFRGDGLLHPLLVGVLNGLGPANQHLEARKI